MAQGADDLEVTKSAFHQQLVQRSRGSFANHGMHRGCSINGGGEQRRDFRAHLCRLNVRDESLPIRGRALLGLMEEPLYFRPALPRHADPPSRFPAPSPLPSSRRSQARRNSHSRSMAVCERARRRNSP
jgi:hypothetical protein